MQNIYDLMRQKEFEIREKEFEMRQKELEIERLKKEIEALRVVAPMLEDKEPAREIATSTSPAGKTYSSTRQNAEPVISADFGKAAQGWP